MARIRTIKPDFWTDEKLAECSLAARLLFIGSWNFADDNGNLPRSAKKLKMQIFPADVLDCEPLIQELLAHGIIQEYSVGADDFLHIKNFKKHQVINKPSKVCLPTGTLPEDSRSTTVVIPEQESSTPVVLRYGREGKGRELEGKDQVQNHPREQTYEPEPPNSDLMVEMLVAAHPKNLKPKKSEFEAFEAIVRESPKFGGAQPAYEYLLERTKTYANKTASWPEKDQQFIVSADTFFREKCYQADEKLWVKGVDVEKAVAAAGGW